MSECVVVHLLRLMFEWGEGCIWCGDDATQEALGLGPVEERVPLGEATRARLLELSKWHDTKLNWEDPAGPTAWTAGEERRFDDEALGLLQHLRRELGPGFRVEYHRL